MNGVAKTSLLTAAMRAKETARPDSLGRLFSDPYAAKLAGQEGFELLDKAIEAAGEQPAIAIRTHFFDQMIDKAIAKDFQQIVLLAAGMDTRAFRLNLRPNIKWFELDRQEVLQYKNRQLENVTPKCQRISLAADLLENWTEALKNAGFDKEQKTVWLVEGLLMYLSESEVKDVFSKLNSMVSQNDMLLLDILSQTLLEVPHMANQLKFLESLGAPWKFGVNDPIRFFEQFGWSATLSQAGDASPERWPFPTAPIHIPNVPRGYFVSAIRK